MKSLKTYLVTMVMLNCAGLLQASSYNFSIFGPSDPDYRLFFSNGINNQEQITGFGFPDVGPEGFLWSHSAGFSEFGVPGSNLTEPFGINDPGEIAGTYYDGLGQHAFVRLPNGTYNTLQIPYAAFGFVPPTFETASATGINNVGEIIGTFQANRSGSTTAYNESFLVNPDGSFELLDLSNNTYVSAISNNGYILGSYVPGNNGFATIVMNTSGQIITTVPNNPLAIPNGYIAQLTSINDNGEIVGSYTSPYDASFVENAFSGQVTKLDLPNGCQADSINDEGIVAGACFNYPSQFYVYGTVGFELTPTPEPGTMGAAFATLALFCAVFWQRRTAR